MKCLCEEKDVFLKLLSFLWRLHGNSPLDCGFSQHGHLQLATGYAEIYFYVLPKWGHYHFFHVRFLESSSPFQCHMSALLSGNPIKLVSIFKLIRCSIRPVGTFPKHHTRSCIFFNPRHKQVIIKVLHSCTIMHKVWAYKYERNHNYWKLIMLFKKSIARCFSASPP